VTCDRWRQTFSAQNFHSNRAISTSLSTRMNNSIKQHLRRTTSRLGHMPISQFLFFKIITLGVGGAEQIYEPKKLFLCLCKTVNALLLPSDPFCTPSAENPTTPECCKCDWLWRVFSLSLTCIIFRAIGTGPINKTTPWSRSGYNGWIGANIHSAANKYIIIGPPKWSTTALSRSALPDARPGQV
jgi:hypothetical protein